MAVGTYGLTHNSVSMWVTPALDWSQYTQVAWYKDGVWQGQTPAVAGGDVWTYSGLTPDTSYTLSASCYYIGGDSGPAGWYGQGSTTIRTLAVQTPPQNVYAVVPDVNGRNVTITFIKSTNTDYVEISTDWSGDYTTTGSSFSFTVPDWDTQYTFWIKACNDSGCSSSSAHSFTSGFAPDDIPPTIDGYAVATPTSVTVTVNCSDYGSGLNYVNIGGIEYNLVGSTGTRSHTFYGYQPGQAYSITATVYDWAGLSAFKTFSGTTPGARPNDFEWDVAKVKEQRIYVYKSEFDAFRTRINQFRQYKGLSVISWIPITAGVTDISAEIYNQARSAIAAMSPPVSPPAAVSTDVDDIGADHFNDIRDSLNSIV